MRTILSRFSLLVPLGVAAMGVPAHSQPIPAGSRYVAMGSSFASGPSVGTSADVPTNRCQRSSENYAHQLATKRNLSLSDVSCGGTTSLNVLEPWRELPAQIDAVTADTRLVTVTIGGNDLGYLGGLIAGSCTGGEDRAMGVAAMICNAIKSGKVDPALTALSSPPTETTWREVGDRMQRIAEEVHRRAPAATLIFIDHVTILPAGPLCRDAPLTPEAAATARATATRLAGLTKMIVKRQKAIRLEASTMSREHGVCTSAPWVSGFSPPAGVANFTSYHPNLAGMTAIADALGKIVR